MKKLALLFLFLMISLFFAGEVFAADVVSGDGAGVDGIGMVFMLKGSVTAERDGKTASLTVKDRIHAKDTVITGANARIQLLLDDETAITLGENTTFEMEEFVNAGKSSRFSTRLGKGLMRIITGEITRSNPEGFKITTPRAMIGVRGTILVVEADEDHTTVVVLNSEFTVAVNGADVPQYSRVTVTEDGTVTVEPLTREQKDEYNEILAMGDGYGSGGDVMPEDGGRPVSEADIAAPDGTVFTDLIRKPEEQGPGSLQPGEVAGSFASNFGNSLSGTFSFNVDLVNGNVTNAAISGAGSVAPYSYNGGADLSAGNFSVSLNGGSGWLSNSAFDINKFSAGTATFNGSPVAGLENSYMYGSVDSGSNVSLDYVILNPDYIYDNGSGSGRMGR
ncbi:hypothetical protein FACS1894216_19420 [Synergistales bacterium]|nr:hypothetical protein FACS1894216_19420 [Synergistales bacterium]